MEIEQFEQLSDLEKRELIFAEWIENLRDPERTQARGYLEVLNRTQTVCKQCCLGVLCEIGWKYGLLDRITEELKVFKPRASGFALLGRYRSEVEDYSDEILTDEFTGASLPVKFREFLNLHYQTEKQLMDMNDVDKASFLEIAWFIETKVMPKVLTLTNDE